LEASQQFSFLQNNPTVTHACRKRRLKWVVTLPLGDINTEAWSSGVGIGREANNLYDYIPKICRKEAEVIQNHDNENVWKLGKSEAQHELGGGQAHDRSTV
jgi:hypothetical protein